MGNIKDLTGVKIGKLLLLERKRDNNRTYYYCECECGSKKWIRADVLKKTGSCGCDREYPFNDLSNKKFGMLTPIKIVGMSKNNGKIWSCKCDCGNEKDIPISNLISGLTVSCGCYQKLKAKNSVKKAGDKFKEKNIIEGTNISFLMREKPIKNNTSGVTGVSFNRASQKWVAFIGFKKKRYWLGSFEKKEDAISVRKEAEEKIHGEFLNWYSQNMV